MMSPRADEAAREGETARDSITAGCQDAAEVKRAAVAWLERQPEMRLEYFEIVDPAAMTPVEGISGPVWPTWVQKGTFSSMHLT